MASTETVKRKFQCRIEELSVIGGFVRNSLVRDVADFAPYSDFDDPYPADYLTEQELVEKATSPVIFINKLKLVTYRLLVNTYGLRPLINSAEIYFNTAGTGLDVMVKDMGQRKVREAINRGDVEQLIGAMKTLNQNIFNNKTVLETKGFTLLKQAELVTKAGELKTDNDLQNLMKEEQLSKTSGNMTLYNSYWDKYVNFTATTGKLIYKESNKTRAKEYTISILKGRIRHEGEQTVIFGKATNAAGEGLAHTKLKLIPVDGGRTKTVYADADGNYSMNGMRATSYNLVATSGVLVKVVPVDVVTRVKQEVNVILS